MLKDVLIRNSLLSLVNAHKNLNDYHLSLAVWFNKSRTPRALNEASKLPIASADEAYLLEVAPEFGFLKMVHAQADSYGLGNIKKLHHWMVSPEKLEKILADDAQQIPELRASLKDENDYEVLHIKSPQLGPLANRIFGRQFGLPDNTREVWYLSASDFEQYKKAKYHPILNTRAGAAVLVIEESPDFVHRKGLMFSQDSAEHWRPNIALRVGDYSWYQDAKAGNPGYFVLGGGLEYSILGFEVVSLPSVSAFLRYPNADNMYVQVLLKRVG
jgi:hypothetical protein